MNNNVRKFIYRGMLFGGFGPIIVGIVYAILEKTIEDFSITGGEILLGIVSTYLLAFVQAGASVFNQIEEWSVPKALLCHFTMLYAAYVLCYLGNTWIPFKTEVVLIFTAIFVTLYFVIWVSVYLTVREMSKKLNRKL